MNAYKVTGVCISIHSGVLILDPEQAEPRRHRLTALGGNRYDVRDPPVCFKCGEIFEIEGELPKTLVQEVEWFVEAKSEPDAKKSKK